jgi:integrase
MGRPRKYRRDLPERVYFKHGAYHYVYPNGKWEKLGNDYAQAMVAWSSKLDVTPQATTTVGDLLNRYLLEIVPAKAERTQKDNRQEIRFLRAFFGAMEIKAVEPKHVVEYVRVREAKTRANREVALLSHAFNKARLWGIATSNPCSVEGIRNRETARERYVTDEEINQFKKEAPEWLKVYIDLKLLLGLRKGDMLKLEWGMLTETSLLVSTRKTGKRLNILRTSELDEVLRRLKTSSGNFFQTISGTEYTSAGFDSTWKRTMVKYVSSGGLRFHEHDLRGKVATDMGDAQAAKALLGHKKIAMTEAYIKARSTDVVQPARRKK